MLGVYYYTKANQMVDHKFTDDVAICMALTKKQAFKKFKKMYDNATIKDVNRLIVKRRPLALTNY